MKFFVAARWKSRADYEGCMNFYMGCENYNEALNPAPFKNEAEVKGWVSMLHMQCVRACDVFIFRADDLHEDYTDQYILLGAAIALHKTIFVATPQENVSKFLECGIFRTPGITFLHTPADYCMHMGLNANFVVDPISYSDDD